MAVVGLHQEPAIALVADQRLVALLQLPFERGQDRSPGGGVLPHLVVVAADDVAPPGERHRLGLVVDLLFAFGQKERDEGRGIVEHEFAHELVAALAHAQNVEQLAGLQLRDRLGADHAAIGDDADPVDRKALAQPVDRGDQAAHVGGVSGPHFGAYRPAVAVEQHRQDHLVEVRPVVLGEAPPPERLPARALEIETGGVHEHQVDRAEEVAPPREQLLLHDVLQATRRKGRCARLLAFGEFFAEPAHGAVEVMKAEALDALDPVIPPPAVGGAIRAARKQAVQNSEENRALQRKIMLARTGEARDDRAAARLLPQALECQGGPDPSRRARRRLAVGDGAHDDGLVGEARARAQQPLQLPALAQIFQATERGDDLLAHRPVLATILDNLEIGATAGGLLSEKHGAEPRRRLIRGPHRIGCRSSKAKHNL